MQRISIIAVVLITGCGTTVPQSRQTARQPAIVPQSRETTRKPQIEYLSGNGPYSFDCDAEPGKSDSRNLRIPSGELQVTGEIQILTARQDPVWEASAGMELVDPAQRAAVALQVLVRKDKPKQAYIGFGMADAQPFADVFTSMPFTSEPIPFSLTVDRSGTISGSLGGVASPRPVRFSGASVLAIGCSTAHVRFSNVVAAPQVR